MQEDATWADDACRSLDQLFLLVEVFGCTLANINSVVDDFLKKCREAPIDALAHIATEDAAAGCLADGISALAIGYSDLFRVPLAEGGDAVVINNLLSDDRCWTTSVVLESDAVLADVRLVLRVVARG